MHAVTGSLSGSMPQHARGLHPQHAQHADSSSPAEQLAAPGQQQQQQVSQQQQQQQQLSQQLSQQQQQQEVKLQQVGVGRGGEAGCEQGMSQQAQVVCACTGRKYHLACLPKEDQAQVSQQHTLPCLCPALPCSALPCLALPCPALPCPALPCLALPRLT